MDKCSMCGVELIVGDNWYDTFHIMPSGTGKGYPNRRCKECQRQKVTKGNMRRMYVDGKYVHHTHPLHKPGRYKTFNDAAFSSLINYVKCVKGEVYIISNPAWKNWYKIGKAVDAEDRCNGYQTSSPHRDYSIVSKISVSNRSIGEKIAHTLAEGMSRERSNEWFRIENLDSEDFDKFLSLVKTLTEEKVNGGVSTNKKSVR